MMGVGLENHDLINSLHQMILRNVYRGLPSLI